MCIYDVGCWLSIICSVYTYVAPFTVSVYYSFKLILLNLPLSSLYSTTATLMSSLPPCPCRTGCGALPSPTQMVPRSCSPQAVPVVTAAASRGTQTMGQSAGSLCLRIWPRGTSSALATDKVHIRCTCEIMYFSNNMQV